jgi:antitoxin component YwqK of YwqJK toxin-antitoxin module
MKKLLLLLLLTASFSTFGLSLNLPMPCRLSFIEEAEIKLEFADFEAELAAELAVNAETMPEIEEEIVLKALIIAFEAELAADLARDELLRAIESLSIEQKVIYEADQLGRFEYPSYREREECKQSPEGSLINDVREGKWTWYDQYNHVIKRGNYINGKKEGQWTEWLHTGNFSLDTIEMNYKNDELDGKWVHWYSHEDAYVSWRRSNQLRIPILSIEIERLRDELKIQEVDLAIETAIYQARLLQEQMIKDRQTQEAVESDQLWQISKSDLEKVAAEAKQKAKLEEQIKNKEKLLFNLELLEEFPRMLAEGNYINGKKEGTWTYWHRSGLHANEVVYENGVLIEK